MIGKLLLSMMLSAGLASAIAATPASAAGNVVTPKQHRGVRLTPEQARVVQAVTPQRHRTSSLPLSGTGKQQRISSAASMLKGPAKVNPSGSRIQGWRVSDQFGSTPSGWYELNLDGSETFLWDYHDPDWVDDGFSEEPPFPFNSGFYKDDRVVGFHSEMLLYWLVWGYGSFSLDGEILDYHVYGEDLSINEFSTYVISCVYDEDASKAYAYTLNADASGYMLQAIDIDSWTFTPIVNDVPIDNVCVGLAFNPDDRKVYGYTPDARFVTLDGATGELSTVTKLDFPVTTKICGMTYSPLDKAFAFVFTGVDDSYATLNLLTPDGQISHLADLPEALQYNILVTPDKIVDAMTPLTPELVALNFPEGALDGSVSVKMPVATFGGQDLTGDISMLTYIDGTLYSETSATPGQTVEAPVNGLQEGIRTFSFSVKSGELESARVEQKLYVGYDIPLAPTDITLTEGTLSWSPVTEGENGGYIDTETLTYNVYLNGEKINEAPVSDCSYTFSMPDDVYQKYVAQVEADNHGHLSQRGFSNDIKAGHSFPLPFRMAPTVAEGELLAVFSQRPGWYQWRVSQNEEEQYLYCSTQSYDEGLEEWVLFPAISIPASDCLLEVAVDVLVQHGYGDKVDENLSVAFGSERNPEVMKVVKTWNGIDNTEEWQTLTAWCLPSEGDTYFGLLTVPHENGGDNIMVRNIRISMSDRPAMTPAEVTELSAIGLPQGQLKAKVDFRMPAVSAAGLSLEGQTLTATVTTPAGSASVSGVAGSLQSVEVATMQGFNDITVTAANENDGLENSISIFTGLDVPAPLAEIRLSHTEDYKALHLEWDTPAEGYNGGFVDPAGVTYALYLYDDENYEWKFAEDLGSATEYDFVPASVEGLAVAGGAILSSNAQGNSGIVLTFESAVGTPYSLPMIEDYNTDAWGPLYSPCALEKPDASYTAEWGFISAAYPYYVSLPTPYGSGAFCAFGSDGAKSRMTLPVFSTVGVESAAIELPIWCGPDAAAVEVYAEAYGMEPELIGSFSDPSETAWRKHRFHLPEKFLGRQWVAIKVDAVFNEGNTVAAFADYRIKTFLPEDVALMEIAAPVYAAVGDEVAVTTLVENSGTESVALPAINLEVYKGADLLETVSMTPAEEKAELAELGQVRYQTVWRPDGNGCGDITFKTVYAGADMDDSNNSRSAVCGITTGNQPVVKDLQAVGADDSDNVLLSWTEPVVETGKEGFENFSSFYYADRLGDFRNINRDGYGSLYFAAFRFPHDADSKGWQVLGESEMTEVMAAAGVENDFVHASSGNNVIAAFAPYSVFVGEGLMADKWLVSPLVNGGSQLKFMLSACVDGYQEDVEVMYSATDDDPESFVSLDKFVLISAGWKEYSYTLPEDARYFAIVYRSISDTGFFVMLDDIEYEPVESAYTIDGYDILRDGLTVVENAAAHGSWTDAYVVPETGAVYNVVPVVNRGGSVSRGFMSNDAHATRSGVADILDSSVRVAAGKGFVTVAGCEGADITVTAADGINVAVRRGVTGSETIRVASGIYVVRVSGRSYRVMVK